MTISIYGFGTMFYGEADRLRDGSFITTEWVTAFCLPLVPLRSFRAGRIVSDVKVWAYRSRSYEVIEKRPIFWPQVVSTYLFSACAIAWWGVMGWLFLEADIFGGAHAMFWVFPFIAVMALPFVALWWLRREAYRSRHGFGPGSSSW